jgi:hypothetical protein
MNDTEKEVLLFCYPSHQKKLTLYFTFFGKQIIGMDHEVTMQTRRTHYRNRVIENPAKLPSI